MNVVVMITSQRVLTTTMFAVLDSSIPDVTTINVVITGSSHTPSLTYYFNNYEYH